VYRQSSWKVCGFRQTKGREEEQDLSAPASNNTEGTVRCISRVFRQEKAIGRRIHKREMGGYTDYIGSVPKKTLSLLNLSRGIKLKARSPILLIVLYVKFMILSI
jgi:hypothetical protein